MIKIAIDAHGGDNAPLSVIEGIAIAADKWKDISISIVGKRESIQKILEEKQLSIPNIEIVNADEVIDPEGQPLKEIRRKGTSMALGLSMLKANDVDAFISPGSTGALMAGALLKVGRIKGVDRPALAPVFPTLDGKVLVLDVGANADCKPLNLKQFGVMGSIYMSKVMGVTSPKVGIINIGTEEDKGNELVKKAKDLLKEADINFIGNVEARDILYDKVDVAVCDGFTGNVILKNTEGAVSFIFDLLKRGIKSSFRSKLGALLMKPTFKDLKKKLDYTEYGASPLLGIDGLVLKAHGSSNAKAIASSIGQARDFVVKEVISQIKDSVDGLGDESNG